MRVVVDTRGVVSAILRDRVPQDVILYIAVHPDFKWVASEPILAEYESVLARAKFGLPPLCVRKWAELLQSVTRLVEVPRDMPFPRAPTDSKFLACALAANADYLITSEKDFEDARKLVSTTILSVSLFKRHGCSRV
jgi:uncharacterized protein